MIRWSLILLGATFPAAAHMVSLSTGEVHVDGERLHYQLLMPSFELSHTSDPAGSLLAQVRFRSHGAEGRVVSSSCNNQGGAYVCDADYVFPAPVDSLSVECNLTSVTVANHVHVLHAFKGTLTDQAVFDLSFTAAELRFRPPTPFEIAMEAAGSGFLRAIEGAAPLLFLLSLALAARSPRELIVLFCSFGLAEVISCQSVRMLPWLLSPRFLEAAAALTVAWLAVETLLLPKAGGRWAVVALLGLFHGMYFSTFLVESRYPAWPFLAGVLLSEMLAIVVLALLIRGLNSIVNPLYATRTAACALLAVSLSWFIIRLKG